MKTRHLHALLATITVALEYDPQDLAALTTLNAQVRDAARKLVGYKDIEVRLGKIPAPVTAPEAIVVKDEPIRASVEMPMVDPLDIPPFKKRS